MSNYFMETQHHEWILTNRHGGYCLGTGNLVNQRKYHGLLIAGFQNLERWHLVESMEEKIEWRGEEIYLDSNNYSNCIYPEGFLHLVKSWLRPYPIFLYSTAHHDDAILILKEIMMDRESNTVMIRYTNLGDHQLHFQLRPKLSMRIHHDLNAPATWDNEQLNTIIGIQGERSFTTYRPSNRMELCGCSQVGEFHYETIIYRNVFYPWEVMLGYTGTGDMVAPVRLDFDLKVGEHNCILFSCEPIEDIDTMIGRITDQTESMPRPSDYPVRSEGHSILESLDMQDLELFDDNAYKRLLHIAFDDFVLKGDIIAGYPWFGAWGRDTMISLEGLYHTPEGIETAWDILNSYGKKIRRGLLPNVLPESGAKANYDSIDAALWYVIRLYQVANLKDEAESTRKEKREIWETAFKYADKVVQGIMKHKTHYRIREDGLVELQKNFSNATWMDARIDNVEVTPRHGAPIEINALWFNALEFYGIIHERLQELLPKKDRFMPDFDLVELSHKVFGAFDKFWTGSYLADRLEGDKRIDEVRPNAVIACGLPFEIIEQEKMAKVFEKAKKELFTEYGLRTLSPKNYRFKKKYIGSQIERDKAYHQGTVWAWLLDPFARLYIRTHEEDLTPKELQDGLGEIIHKFRNGFLRGHIASVAEVWDGDKPHFPKGCPAQAWSVAAVYNIEKMIENLQAREEA